MLPWSNGEYLILEHDSICSPFFLCHNPASVLHPNASVSTQSKMDQFSCFSPFLLHSLPPHPNIPPFRVVCHSNKSSEGGFRQCAVTHVTTGAKSELSGQRDANKLEIYAGGFIVAYFIWGNAGPVLMSVLHLWTGMSCREAHVDSAVYCQCNDKQYEQGIEWENPLNLWCSLISLAVILSPYCFYIYLLLQEYYFSTNWNLWYFVLLLKISLNKC